MEAPDGDETDMLWSKFVAAGSDDSKYLYHVGEEWRAEEQKASRTADGVWQQQQSTHC